MTAEEMWRSCRINGEYQAWSFGGEPDKLADLVKNGIKTATCSALVFYENDGEAMPKTGDHSVILDSNGDAVCVIRTKKVYIEEFGRVSEDHAFKEGEGDRTLAYWRQVHEKFFTDELKTIGMSFDKSLKLVCEEFELVQASI